MNELTYEKAYKRLEEIVEKLESGSVPLEESMKLFEEGTKLADFCNAKLNAAEQKFTQLITDNSGSDKDE